MLLSLLLAALMPPTDTLMGNTCVPRFHYCLVYPHGFVMQPPSENGDGAVMLSKDEKAEVRTWGRIQMDASESVQAEISGDMKELKVAYKLIKPNAAIISGTDKDGNIVYEKIVLVNEEFHRIRFTYPAAQQDKYGWYCGYVAKAKMVEGEAFDLHQHTH